MCVFLNGLMSIYTRPSENFLVGVPIFSDDLKLNSYINE
ncbi:hypothetical protein NEIFL0001_1529 [Neisseria flavescens SK114]|nr:hypothetical protein NEIFL0001_1529 [Neisseria flavescens SK114]